MVNARRRVGEIPRKKRPVLLTARDLHVCRALLKAGRMRTSDFVPLIFPSLGTARRRLLKLLDANVLAAHVEASHEDTRWEIEAKGRALVQGDEVRMVRRRAARDFGRHREALVRFWVLAVHACHRGEATLKRFRFEWELEAVASSADRSKRPDALLTVEKGRFEQSFWVEIDRGTESVGYIVREKLLAFANVVALRQLVAGVRPGALLFATTSERRLAAIREAATAIAVPTFGTVFTERSKALSLLSGWQPLTACHGDRGGGIFPGGAAAR